MTRHGSSSVPSLPVAAVDDADRLDRRQPELDQVAEQAVLAEGEALAGLLDGVHVLAEPHDPHDVAGDAAGQLDEHVVAPLLQRGAPRAG